MCDLEAPFVGRGAGQAGLLGRAVVLLPKDRLLLELAFQKNLSVRQIGVLFGRPAGTVSRQLQRICARLRDPLVLALLDRQCPLPVEYRQLALEHFAQGQNAQQIADLHQIPAAQVRSMLTFVRGWHGVAPCAAS